MNEEKPKVELDKVHKVICDNFRKDYVSYNNGHDSEEGLDGFFISKEDAATVLNGFGTNLSAVSPGRAR